MRLRTGGASVNNLARQSVAVYPQEMTERPEYVLDDQIGYVLRRVTQRHLAIFTERLPQITSVQWAVLARLSELGPLSQNHLGRMTAMDAATIKGVVDRLARQGLVETAADPNDKRRLTVSLTGAGAALFSDGVATAVKVSAETLGPLTAPERAQLLALLLKLV